MYKRLSFRLEIYILQVVHSRRLAQIRKIIQLNEADNKAQRQLNTNIDA